MTTKDFEQSFLTTFEQHLQQRYPQLDVKIPRSGIHPGVPTPDVIVTNPATGHLMALELKSGFQSSYIPLSILPQLKSMRDYYAAHHGDVVFITTGDIPQLVQHRLAESGITYYRVRTPSEAIASLQTQLEALSGE